MAANQAVTAAADDEEEFEEFESEHWPITQKEDASLWDAEVNPLPAALHKLAASAHFSASTVSVAAVSC